MGVSNLRYAYGSIPGMVAGGLNEPLAAIFGLLAKEQVMPPKNAPVELNDYPLFTGRQDPQAERLGTYCAVEWHSLPAASYRLADRMLTFAMQHGPEKGIWISQKFAPEIFDNNLELCLTAYGNAASRGSGNWGSDYDHGAGNRDLARMTLSESLVYLVAARNFLNFIDAGSVFYDGKNAGQGTRMKITNMTSVLDTRIKEIAGRLNIIPA